MKAANEIYAETSAKNAKFKKVYESMQAFRDDQLQWFSVAEATFDGFVQRNRRALAPQKKG
jgi:TRAP-type mannitol/chloroaromatic compound transport system substrate-binding protein